MRRIIALIISLFVLFSSVQPVYAYTQILDMLCDSGVEFYNDGKYNDAMGEFRRALVIDSKCPLAIKYIKKIELIGQEGVAGKAVSYEELPQDGAVSGRPHILMGKVLDLADDRIQPLFKQKSALEDYPGAAVLDGEDLPVKKKVPLFQESLVLNQGLRDSSIPIEIPQGESLNIVGRNIQRFLVTDPVILDVQRVNPDKIVVLAKNIGFSDLLVWDDYGRWSLGFLGIFPVPEETYQEWRLREEQRSRNFKFKYSFDWFAIQTGSRIHNLKRNGSYSYLHSLSLIGQTPYGDLDSTVTYRRLATTELTYATLGVTDGQLGDFEGWSFRGGDFNLPVSNMAFPGTTLRGTMFSSPAFDDRFDYTVFWGREDAGRIGLFPDLYQSENSFLSGAHLNYSPFDAQDYKFTLVHGWGRDRDDFLNEYGYDFEADWDIGNNWGLEYESAFDTKKFAQLATTTYNGTDVRFLSEFRNINKDFVSITGNGWRQGELGGFFDLGWKVSEDTDFSGRLDVFQDRKYPAIDNDDRWNQDLDWSIYHRIDELNAVELGYLLRNDLGQLSQTRYLSPSFGYSHTFKWLRDIYAFTRYSYARNQNFTSSSLSYYNNRAIFGFRFNVIDNLYYYFNKEINWLYETYNQDRSMPSAIETGLDWSNQLGNSPLYSSIRFTYRDEEDALSPLSFLSGQDYIEGYTELAYRRDPDKEVYGSVRLRNTWAENPTVDKRMEASFNAGLRYLWDTGLSWDAVCNIYVTAFRDLNSDGLRQRSEPPVEGAVIWVGNKRSQTTDLFGSCEFKGTRGRTAYVSFDLDSLPRGYLLTVPQTQEVKIVQNQTIEVNFGMISRSEITGKVFIDENANGQQERGEEGIDGVVIVLDDTEEALTDASGRFVFANVATGEHTLEADINTIPLQYLPKVLLKKKVTLYEGMTYQYNIPLSRIKE
ncbi:MAG: pilus assembly protein N-terminal domain-containing protein [Candidatus Omnitrophica bacterium]|nr:pilus assembly protein N-terminal domain-containing protein [Candidatus Omnitrophota bacterium]